jgi:hypothetical protein
MTEKEKDVAAHEKEVGQFDDAAEFLRMHEAASWVNIIALRRKIDIRIIPLMFCCYTMQFLDKVILNVS